MHPSRGKIRAPAGLFPGKGRRGREFSRGTDACCVAPENIFQMDVTKRGGVQYYE